MVSLSAINCKGSKILKYGITTILLTGIFYGHPIKIIFTELKTTFSVHALANEQLVLEEKFGT